MPYVEDVTIVQVTKLEARIIFDRMLFEPSDDFSHAIRNLLRVALRDEPDDRHSMTAPLKVTKRQCYRIINSIRDSFNNEISRSLADKVMDALLQLETQESVEDFLRGTPIAADPKNDRAYPDLNRYEERA